MSDPQYSNKPTPTSYLITHLKLTGTLAGAPVINFYSPPLQHAVLQLFDFSLLFTVGIDPNKLEPGVDHHCRFVAHYRVSEKQKSTGNPYLNITRLEPISVERPNPALGELRAIKALLQHLATLAGNLANGSTVSGNGRGPNSTTLQAQYNAVTKEQFAQATFNHLKGGDFYTEPLHIVKTIPIIAADWQPDTPLQNKAMLAALTRYQEKSTQAAKLKMPHAQAHKAAVTEAQEVYARIVREETQTP